MSALEAAVMTRLGWKAAGLIESAGNSLGTLQADADAPGDTAAAPLAEAVGATSRRRRRRSAPSSDIRLLACDMDGTLLDSRSRMLPSTVEALKVSVPSNTLRACAVELHSHSSPRSGWSPARVCSICCAVRVAV